MLTTIESKNKITEMILDKIPDADLSFINFTTYKEGMPYGDYAFSLSDKYCFLSVAGFTISKETDDFDEFFWRVLHAVIQRRSTEYELKNRIYGQDCRRIIFEKEIEEFSLFGEKYRERITKEVEYTLKISPYNDDAKAFAKPPRKKPEFLKKLPRITAIVLSILFIVLVAILPYILPE